MKIKSISFTNFHRGGTFVYQLNDAATYFVGPNGAGKSTILEAIQLALLGYIPGYAKTNEGIMKHCVSNNLSVNIELEGRESVAITRQWIRSGSSVKSTVVTDPEQYNVEEIFNEVELPIYNFSEFTNLTANKLKEWFIKFLPNEAGDIDWDTELSESLSDSAICSPTLLESVKIIIDEVTESGKEGIDLVAGVNAKLKDAVSFNKGQLQRLQGTINSLVHYDDTDNDDEDEINESIAALTKLRSEVVQWNTQYEPIRERIANMLLPASRPDEDEEVIQLAAQVTELEKKEDELGLKIAQLRKEYNEKSSEYAQLTAIRDYTCPYTKAQCDSIKAMFDDNQAKAKKIYDEVAALTESINALQQEKGAISRELMAAQSKKENKESQYRTLATYQSMLKDAPQAAPSDRTVEDIDAELASLNERVKKLGANRMFNELSDKLTSEKFELENDIKCLNDWVKLTGANGLQNRLIAAPFSQLKDDMTDYLTKFFKDDVAAAFNLSEKNNSFSFGITRDGKYVEYASLSSGEKCLFTLAMMNCLLKCSGCDLQVIIVDDLLDHLDGDNASQLFDLISSQHGVQYILAGVQPCATASIIQEV